MTQGSPGRVVEELGGQEEGGQLASKRQWREDGGLTDVGLKSARACGGLISTGGRLGLRGGQQIELAIEFAGQRNLARRERMDRRCR